MSFSMHRISVPVFQQMLTNLDYCFEQAAAFVSQNGMSETEFMQRRLIEDMFTLAQQVQRACEHSAGAVARLAGVSAPALASDPDADIGAARARIATSLEFLASIAPDQLEGDPDRPITVTVRLGEVTWPAQDYLLHFAQAHFYFHVTTAYDILRAAGVDIGKIDYLGAIMKDKFAGQR
ncbi:MAG: DUF1993 domain-containing protein [Alphaproteobacteria bacterium]|nr:DUF1993 domain-containing protein [Alphaproteobacteria bacterium]